MKIAIIAAIGKNGELGKDGKLPWHLPEDLKYFKRMTMDHVVVMGRKTYESIPKKLEGRTIIVLTTQIDYKLKYDDEDALVFNSVGEIIHYCYSHDVETLYVAGGGAMYKHFLPLADQLYLTQVDAEFDADVYFPELHKDEWQLRSTKWASAQDTYCFEYYERKIMV